MPNIFAYLALFSWPIISLSLFKKLPTTSAIIITIIGGVLFLPSKVNVDLPLLPPLDKHSITAICAYFGCRFIKNENISFIPHSGIEKWFIVVMLTLPFIQVLTNQFPVFNGQRWLPSLSFYDAISDCIRQAIYIIPFLLGLQLFKTFESHLVLFRMLVIACLIYSLPILFEIRMSPQLHVWIYGFFPHESFGQMMRQGGFRAVVFMNHGLQVAMFITISLGAALILWKNDIKIKNFSPLMVVIYIFVLLVLSKSIAPLVYGVILIITIAWLPNSISLRSAQLMMLLVMFYPTLSMSGLFPHQDLLEFIASYSTERAQSLGFRFEHEKILVEHAQNQLFFGWGGWGRNRMWDSVTDGFWIIIFGIQGLVGFAVTFGLAFLGVIRGIKVSKNLNIGGEQKALTTLILVVSIIMLDQLTNASMTGWMWLIIGALLGRVKDIREQTELTNAIKIQR